MVVADPGSGCQVSCEESGLSVRTACFLVLLSLFLTLLNAVKPLTLDDSVYSLFATHLAQHPLDPYGFLAWGIQPANSILAPPVLLYWWMLAVRFGGPDPLIWKLWLFPFCLLWVGVLHALGRRFARPLALPFVCLVSLSPALLPCLNLMMDIPALALSLLAVLLFLRACSARSLGLTLAAGLVAGLATQTKYTAFIACGVILLHGVLAGRGRRALAVVALAVLIFVGWEALIAWRYGHSHFWLGFTQFRAPLAGKLKLIQPLVGYLGSTLMIGVPLGLAAAGLSRHAVRLATGVVALLVALVVLVPNPAFARPWPGLTSLVPGVLGCALLGVVGATCWRLLRQPRPAREAAPRWTLASVDGFLVLWLALEVAGYFALSPYPATRRILGVVVVSLLLLCRQAARVQPPARLVWGLVGVNFLFGLGAFVVDYNLYAGQKVLAEALAHACHEKRPQARTWFLGNGSFEFYGERLGMENLLGPEQRVAAGDWVLVQDGYEPDFERNGLRPRCAGQEVWTWSPVVPLRSQYQYGNVAFARLEAPLVRVVRFRVVR